MTRALPILLLCLSILCYGQTPSTEQRKKDVAQLEHEIVQANFTCDFELFRRVEAEEFIFTDSRGNITMREEDLSRARECRKSDAKFSLDDVWLNLYGDTAVYNARLTITRMKDGAPVTSSSRFTDVLVWRDGRWQIVAGHSSRIADRH